MKKLAIAALSAGTVFALTGGTASAQVGSTCPTNSSSLQEGSSGEVVTLPGGFAYVDADNTRTGGESPLGFAEADPSISGTDVTYSGETNGEASGLGYGEIENGSAGTSGVSGSSDADAPLNLGSSEGSLNQGSTLNAEFEVAGTCVSVDVP